MFNQLIFLQNTCSSDEEDAEVLEESPCKRWTRHEKVKQWDVPGIDAAYLAKENETGNKVVWNVMPFSERKNIREQEEKTRALFDNLVRLEHPNLVKIHEYWMDTKSDKPKLIFITEYMSSESMSCFLQRTRSSGSLLNIKKWKIWARQILDALSYLHSFEPPIVHANLTCNSVFILQNEQVKIGCVAPKTIHHHVETLPENVKNVHYLAPEYNHQTEMTIQADIYSFGVCALEMATTGALQSGCFNGASNAASMSLPPHAASALSSASESSSCSHVVITKEMVYKALNSLDQQPEQKQFIERCLELDPARRANVTDLLGLLSPPKLDPELQQQMFQPGTSAATITAGGVPAGRLLFDSDAGLPCDQEEDIFVVAESPSSSRSMSRCSLDSLSLRNDLESIQKNTFTRWVNQHLKEASGSPKIENLATDFHDGILLIELAQVLAKRNLGRFNRKPTKRAQKLDNISTVLTFFKKKEHIKIENIGSSDIADLNLKLILGLVWTLILHYSLSQPIISGESVIGSGVVGNGTNSQHPSPRKSASSTASEQQHQQSPKERLLAWIQERVPYLPVTNFTSDWTNGIVLSALVDACLGSDAFAECRQWTDEGNDALLYTRRAMQAAEDKLGVSKLITPEELTNPNVDDKSVMTYLSQFPRARPLLLTDLDQTEMAIQADIYSFGSLEMATTGALQSGCFNGVSTAASVSLPPHAATALATTSSAEKERGGGAMAKNGPTATASALSSASSSTMPATMRARTIELENERLRLKIDAGQMERENLSARYRKEIDSLTNDNARLQSARVDLELARLHYKKELAKFSDDQQTRIQQRDDQISQLKKELETASKHIQQRDDQILLLQKEKETASKDHQTHIQQRDGQIAQLKKELETASKDHQTHNQQRDDQITLLQKEIALLTVAKQSLLKVKAQLDAVE